MNDLITQIVEKTGVTAQQAQESVAISVEWVTEKLPSDAVEQLEGLLGGATGMATGAIGKAKDTGSSMTSAAGSIAASGADVAGSAWENTKGSVSGLMPGDL